jgi:hypothetical protein
MKRGTLGMEVFTNMVAKDGLKTAGYQCFRSIFLLGLVQKVKYIQYPAVSLVSGCVGS